MTAGNPISSLRDDPVSQVRVSTVQEWLARAAWVVPILLLLLAADQAKVAFDLSETLRDGQPGVAKVTEYERIDRADVTYGYVSLSVRMEDGRLIQRDRISLPHSLMKQLEGSETVRVRVLSNADQEIVIESIASTQWKIAAIQSVIALLAFLMALVAVTAWNRSLSRIRSRQTADFQASAV